MQSADVSTNMTPQLGPHKVNLDNRPASSLRPALQLFYPDCCASKLEIISIIYLRTAHEVTKLFLIDWGD